MIRSLVLKVNELMYAITMSTSCPIFLLKINHTKTHLHQSDYKVSLDIYRTPEEIKVKNVFVFPRIDEG